MYIKSKKLTIVSALIIGVSSTAVDAAKPVNLRYANKSILQTLIAPSAAASISIAEINRNVDFNHTLHVRIQEMYMGYPVIGGDAVVHISNGDKSQSLGGLLNRPSTMNGTIYENLQADLKNAPAIVFTQDQANKALQNRVQDYQKAHLATITEKHTQLMIFLTEDNKAHWVYKVSFETEPANASEKPVRMVYLVDAISFKVYVSWDDIKNLTSVSVDGGGFGGNIKMGKLVYDGQKNNLASLSMMRDDKTQNCFLQNADVTVKDRNTGRVMNFACETGDSDHNNVYWSADFDKVNDGFSPGNDALFGGQVIKHMYKDWYGIPVLVNPDGSPMMLNMVVHLRHYDNAYWDGRQMSFGDGATMFYPLTSLGVAAHEISHGFTEQHSNLAYWGQSGGMNEAFSDMAAQAAEVYAYGKNSWQIGPEIFKAKNRALRYMDLPSKDCKGHGLRQCSIDNATQYYNGLDVHYSSGVYNRFFYTLGTAKGWDAKKAFDVMVHANSNYWTSNVTFKEAACGVISAATDLGFDTGAVKAAFDVVKVDYTHC